MIPIIAQHLQVDAETIQIATAESKGLVNANLERAIQSVVDMTLYAGVIL